MTRLCKSRNRVLAGVCGGFAEYFNIDPTIVRVALVAFTAVGGSGLLVYVVAAILMPEPDSDTL